MKSIHIVSWSPEPDIRPYCPSHPSYLCMPVLWFRDAYGFKCPLHFRSASGAVVKTELEQSHGRVVVVLVEAFVEEKDHPLELRGFLHSEEVAERTAGFARGIVLQRKTAIDHVYGQRKILKPHPPLLEHVRGRGYRIGPRGLCLIEV